MIPNAMFLGLAYALIIMAIMAVLLAKGRMGRKGAIAAAVLTVMIGGLLLGGVPDPVTQFHQAVRGLSLGQVPVQPLLGLALLTALALATGRLFCGHACPLGAAQELMSHATKRKVNIDRYHPRLIRAAFTVMLAVMAVATPVFLSVNPFRFYDLRFVLGASTMFLIVLAASVLVYRPWCRLLCPFGAISELASRRSALGLHRRADCTDCGRCVRVCPTSQPVPGSSMSECYLCGRCLDACRKDCLVFGQRGR